MGDWRLETLDAIATENARNIKNEQHKKCHATAKKRPKTNNEKQQFPSSAS